VDSQLRAKLADLELGEGGDGDSSRSENKKAGVAHDELLQNWAAPEVRSDDRPYHTT
jgi:hypothetical protein